jgi:hypothetical protein
MCQNGTVQPQFVQDTCSVKSANPNLRGDALCSLCGVLQATGGVYKSVDRGVSWVPITGNLAVDLNQIHQDLALSNYYRAIGWVLTSGVFRVFH